MSPLKCAQLQIRGQFSFLNAKLYVVSRKVIAKAAKNGNVGAKLEATSVGANVSHDLNIRERERARASGSAISSWRYAFIRACVCSSF